MYLTSTMETRKLIYCRSDAYNFELRFKSQGSKNVSVLFKLLERLVAKQLIDYLKSAKLFPLYQSAYRMNHSTETAVLHVVSEILTAANRGDFLALVLLDLSAAFDTADHEFCSNVCIFHTVSPDVH